MGVLPLGTIIRKENKTAMIVGYGLLEEENTLIPAYQVILHPSGYINHNSVRLFLQSEVEVVQMGFCPEGLDITLEGIQKMNKSICRISKEEWAAYLEQKKREANRNE